MPNLNSRAREGGQVAPRWCITKHVDIITLLTLADATGDIEWQACALDELIRLPSRHRRRLLSAHRLQIGACDA
jgi:hypothetical protein